MEERVVIIHALSVATHLKEAREDIYRGLAESKIGVICCPKAWRDSWPKEELAPISNSITPAKEMLAFGIEISVGTDNIRDIYKALSNGDFFGRDRGLHGYAKNLR